MEEKISHNYYLGPDIDTQKVLADAWRHANLNNESSIVHVHKHSESCSGVIVSGSGYGCVRIDPPKTEETSA